MQHIHRYVYFWTTGSGTRHVGALLLVVGAPWDDAPSKTYSCGAAWRQPEMFRR